MTDIEAHVTYALRNAAIREWPFPHFIAENVFPDDFYWSFSDAVRKKTDYLSAENNYHGRQFAAEVDFPELDFMHRADFARHVAKIFAPWLTDRISDGKLTMRPDLRLIRDGQGYFIGPHTDAKWKLVSLLFYLPFDGWHARHGTALYVPRDPDFRCPGGPHHKFDAFQRVATAPFVPNTCVGFVKSDISFHGVEPINDDFQRDVLLYNLYAGGINLRSDNT